MAGPWEEYQKKDTVQHGPWEEYGVTPGALAGETAPPPEPPAPVTMGGTGFEDVETRPSVRPIGTLEKLAPAVVAAPVMGGLGLGAAGIGATVGGLQGLQETGTPRGAVTGGAIGAAAPLALAGVARGAPMVADALRLRPSTLKQGAGAIYKGLESEAGNLPIPLTKSGPLLDKAASEAEWVSWPTGLRKLYNRVTAPDKAGMTYKDAQAVVSELGDRANAAYEAGKANLARKYWEAQRGILGDTQDALAQIGKDAQYAKARGDWARAKQLEEQYATLKKYLVPVAIGGLAGVAGQKIYKAAGDVFGW